MKLAFLTKNIALIGILLVLGNAKLYCQIFAQDFSSSAVVADYVSASSPNTGQFNAISTSGAGTVVSISSGKLQFARTGNAGSFSRASDFSPTPGRMMYKFSLNVTGNTAQTNAAVFQIGSGFGTANSTETNANTYARIGINFTGTSGNWQLREIGSSTNSTTFTGEQNITWVLNNTGASITYIDPNLSDATLANDKVDIWVGSTLVFDDFSVQTTTQTMTDLKFVISAGTGTITIDDLNITSDFALPISLSTFSAASDASSTLLTFATASERNNARFEIERSADGRVFQVIGAVKGAGDAQTQNNYSFTDEHPMRGINYYRLRQVDVDGASTLSQVVSVTFGKTGNVVLYPTPASETMNVRFDEAFTTDANWQIVDLTGRILNEGIFAAEQVEFRIPVASLTQGAYILRVTANNEVVTQQFRKQ